MRASRRGHEADVILARGNQYSTRPASASHTFSTKLQLGKKDQKIEIDVQCFLIGANDGNYRFKKKLYDKINNYKLGHKVKLTSSTILKVNSFIPSEIFW